MDIEILLRPWGYAGQVGIEYETVEAPVGESAFAPARGHMLVASGQKKHAFGHPGIPTGTQWK